MKYEDNFTEYNYHEMWAFSEFGQTAIAVCEETLSDKTNAQRIAGARETALRSAIRGSKPMTIYC